MTEETKAILGIVGTTIALVFSKNIWEDRKHSREIKANLKGKDEELKRKENEIAGLKFELEQSNKERDKAKRRVKKLESY